MRQLIEDIRWTIDHRFDIVEVVETVDGCVLARGEPEKLAHARDVQDRIPRWIAWVLRFFELS